MTSGTYHIPRLMHQRGAIVAGIGIAQRENGRFGKYFTFPAAIDTNEHLTLSVGEAVLQGLKKCQRVHLSGEYYSLLLAPPTNPWDSLNGEGLCEWVEAAI